MGIDTFDSSDLRRIYYASNPTLFMRFFISITIYIDLVINDAINQGLIKQVVQSPLQQQLTNKRCKITESQMN